jgi:hypothetical protein
MSGSEGSQPLLWRPGMTGERGLVGLKVSATARPEPRNSLPPYGLQHLGVTGVKQIPHTYIRVTAAVSTVKKSHASTPAAWERRNSAQVGPPRLGAGTKPCRRRMLRTEVADTFIPSLAHSPQIRR